MIVSRNLAHMWGKILRHLWRCHNFQAGADGSMLVAIIHAIRSRRGQRVQRNIPDRSDPLYFSDGDLIKRYRFPRSSIIGLATSMENELKHRTMRSNALSPVSQVCVALNYYATGALFGNLQSAFNVSKPTISRVIHRVSAVLTNRLCEEVFIPSPANIDRNCQAFFDIAHFPNVLGCIDGSHVRIKPPSEDEFINVNRKGYHSINMQCICDPYLCFIDVVVRYPGSSADSFIFNQCGMKNRLDSNVFEGKVLLGDSAYALRTYMLTPFMNPQTQSECNYNCAHRKTRVTIERAFGVLKSRFLCLSHKLSGPILFSPKRACAVISACIYLHNKARRLNLHVDEEIFSDDQQLPHAVNDDVDPSGWSARAYVVRHYFS